MLVLCRKIGESIIIGDHLIEIMVLKSPHSSIIRLGIEAPEALSIHRSEIFDQIRRTLPKNKDKTRTISERITWVSDDKDDDRGNK